MTILWGHCQAHNWTKAGSVCPYGYALPGQVTWPSSEVAARHGVTFRGWDFTPSNVLLAVCVLYSYVPYAVFISAMIAFILRRGTRELSVLFFFAATCIAAELLVLLHYFKGADNRRPEQSCVASCGSPSTKSALAIGCCLVRFFDNLTRSRPIIPAAPPPVVGPLAAQLRNCDVQGPTVSSRSLRVFDFLSEVGGAAVPLASWDEVFGGFQVVFLALWIALLLPVPLAVVQLNDNSPEQALFGVVVGFGVAGIWVVLMRIVQHHYNHYLGHQILGCFLRHNLALPCFMAERRCSEPRNAIPRRPSFMSSTSWVYQGSVKPDVELRWYLEQTQRRRALLQSLGMEEGSYLQERAIRLDALLRGCGSATCTSGSYLTTGSLRPGPPRMQVPTPLSGGLRSPNSTGPEFQQATQSMNETELSGAREGSRSLLEREGSTSVLHREGSKSLLEREGSRGVLEREGSRGVLEREGSRGVLDRQGSSLGSRAGSGSPAVRGLPEYPMEGWASLPPRDMARTLSRTSGGGGLVLNEEKRTVRL